MSKVFLSYRRDDSAAYAGRLYDRLASRFGSGEIFMDIDHIEPGEDFIEIIKGDIRASNVLIVLIGRQWASLVDRTGSRRLDNPEDFIRLEVRTALDQGVRIIPVLVGGASMPPAQDLPKPLQPLARRHAIELSDLRFHLDVDRLIETIEKILAPAAVQTEKTGGVSAVVVNAVHSKDSETADSKTEGDRLASGIGNVRTGFLNKWPVKLWIGRFLILAATGFVTSLGVAWMQGAKEDHGVRYPYITSPDFWEVDVWLLWPFLTICFGVLFAVFRRLRDKKGDAPNWSFDSDAQRERGAGQLRR